MIINPAYCDVQPDGFLKIRFSIDCEGSLPKSTAARAFGNVNYSGTITVDEKLRQITADLAIDDFPAFEAYGSINGNAGKSLLQKMPELGSTTVDLGGTAGTTWRLSGRNIKSTVQDEDQINPDDVIWVDTSQPPSPKRNKKIIRRRKKHRYHSSLRDSNNSGDFDHSLYAAGLNDEDYLPFDTRRMINNSNSMLMPLMVNV